MPRTISQLDSRDNVEIQEEVHQVRGRRNRNALGGVSDILACTFKDPEFDKKFHWEWELGDDENSPSLFHKLNNLGFEFVTPDELSGSQAQYQKSVSAGTLVRVPAGKKQSGWLYLLKQPMEYRKEDEAIALEEGQSPVKAMKRKAREEMQGVGRLEQNYQSF